MNRLEKAFYVNFKKLEYINLTWVLDRFGIKPNICEKSPRKPSSNHNSEEEEEEGEQQRSSQMRVNSAEVFIDKGMEWAS